MSRDILDDELAELVLDIDTNIFKWIETHKLNGLEMTAIVLARLVWCAKMGAYEEDFLKLLEAPKALLTNIKPDKETLH